MNRETITKGIAKIKDALIRHRPETYAGGGMAFSVLAVGLGIYETIKACHKIDEIKKEQGVDKLSAKEIAKAIWPNYISVLAAEAISLTFQAGAIHENHKALTALSTAYTLSDTAFRQYRDKVAETVGPKKAKEIHEGVTDDIISQHPVQKECIIDTGRGDVLFFDVVSGVYFYSNIEYIKKIINELNYRMRNENYIPLNELYSEIGLEECACGDMLGWNIERGMIDVRFDAKLTRDGTPCVVLAYDVPPRYGYDY